MEKKTGRKSAFIGNIFRLHASKRRNHMEEGKEKERKKERKKEKRRANPTL